MRESFNIHENANAGNNRNYVAAHTLGSTETTQMGHRAEGWFVTRAQAALVGAFVILMLVMAVFLGRATVRTPQLIPKENENFNETREMIAYESLHEVDPFMYVLYVKAHINGSNFQDQSPTMKFYGNVTISLRVKKPMKIIELEANNLSLIANSIRLTQRKEGEHKDESSQLEDFSVSLKSYNDGVEFELNKPLMPTAAYDLQIAFSGNINTISRGLYQYSYLDVGKSRERKLYLTNFSPNYANMVFPCFDTASQKAAFNISIARPTNLTSYASGTFIRSITEGDDLIWDEYTSSDTLMAPHFVGFAITEPPVVSTVLATSGISFTLWCAAEKEKFTILASEQVEKLAMFFTNLYTMSLPTKVITILALPEPYFNITPSASLITISEYDILVDNETCSERDRELITATLSRILSDQWIRQAITFTDEKDDWFLRALIDYSTFIALNSIESNYEIMDEFNVQIFLDDSVLNNYQDVKNITNPAENSIGRKNKGLFLLKMLNSSISEGVFHSAISEFLHAKKFHRATSEDFFDMLTNRLPQINSGIFSSEPLKANQIVENWMRMEGYPYIYVRIESGHVIFEQKSFPRRTSPKNLWIVPLSLITDAQLYEDTLPKFWLNTQILTIPVNNIINLSENKWFLLNPGQTAPYRVLYDKKNWNLLLSSIKNFPHNIKSQILDDALAFSRYDLLGYELSLNITKEILLSDASYLVWDSFLRHANFFTSCVEANNNGETPFSKFMLTVLKPFADDFGKIKENSAQSEIILWVGKYFAASINEKEILKINDSADIKRSIKCVKMYSSKNAKEFDDERNKNSNETFFQFHSVLEYLICYNDKKQIENLLKESLLETENKKQRVLNAESLAKGYSKNGALINANNGLSFLRKNWPQIINLFRDNETSLAKLINSITNLISDEDGLEDMEKNVSSEILLNALRNVKRKAMEKSNWKINQKQKFINALDQLSK